jgi:hypothetical protein
MQACPKQTSLLRLVATLVLIVAIAPAVRAATPLLELRASPDITVDLSGTTPDDEDLISDDLRGTVTLLDIASVPDTADLDAYHRLRNDDQLFSLDTTVDFGEGLVATPGDVVRFDGTGFKLEFDGSAHGLPASAVVDAVSVIDAGDLLLSFDITISVDGITVDDEDLVSFDGADFTLFFDGSAAGVDEALALDAAHHLDPNGNLLLSLDGSGTLGDVAFDDEDVLEYDPVGGTWEMSRDGSAEHSSWIQADLDALHAVAAGAGAVPDGADVPGAPLTIDTATESDITLTWSASCFAGDTDYAIYEGLLGDFSSHEPVTCTTDGATTETITPGTGSRYYLVVPQGDAREGSCGRNSDGGERPPSVAACLPQLVTACDQLVFETALRGFGAGHACSRLRGRRSS